ncbi:hypothetical protein [Streptomyces cinereoruber]|uniref:hypothetical protein n=1 Tax=Streptomyces cinereoruber TaxID=67260 RepID=UPI003635EF76
MRLVGEFGALLLAGHLTAVPDEHADCESAYVAGKLVTSRYLERWCLASGAGAHTARIAAGFLIECIQEVDQVSQFLADVRGDADGRRPRPEPGRRPATEISPPPGTVRFRWGCRR